MIPVLLRKPVASSLYCRGIDPKKEHKFHSITQVNRIYRAVNSPRLPYIQQPLHSYTKEHILVFKNKENAETGATLLEILALRNMVASINRNKPAVSSRPS